MRIQDKITFNEKVLKLCDKVRECDDKLGQFSDYEGNIWGPTWSLWNEGKEDFEGMIETAIEYHKDAIKVWREFRKLNDLRGK